MNLIFIYNIYSLVPLRDSQEHIRLIDDAFAKVCNAINDLSLTVRTQAAQLLVM